MNEDTKFGWADLIYVLILTMLFWSMLIGMVSCTPSKKNQTTVITKTDSILIKDTVTITKTDTVSVTKIETKTETETDFIFDTIYKENPPRIIYKNDGSIEVSGLKAARMETSLMFLRYDSVRRQNEQFKASTFYWQNKAEEFEEQISRKKGIPAIIWIMWTLSFIIALCGGVYIGVRFRNFFV